MAITLTKTNGRCVVAGAGDLDELNLSDPADAARFVEWVNARLAELEQAEEFVQAAFRRYPNLDLDVESLGLESDQ